MHIPKAVQCVLFHMNIQYTDGSLRDGTNYGNTESDEGRVPCQNSSLEEYVENFPTIVTVACKSFDTH